MNAVLSIIVVIVATNVVAYVIPRAPIKPTTVLLDAADSTSGSASVVILQETSQEEAESSRESNPRISPGSFDEPPQKPVHGLMREPSDVSLTINNPISFTVVAEGYDSKTILTDSIQESIAAPAPDDHTGVGEHSVAAEINNDVDMGDEFFPNTLAQQAIEALVQELTADLKLHPLSSLALERLLPPQDALGTSHNIINPSDPRLSLGLIQESDAKPVVTILNLWESDEEDKRSSNVYGEDKSPTKESDEDSSYL